AELQLAVPFESNYHVGGGFSLSGDYYLDRRFAVRGAFGYRGSGTDFAGDPTSSAAYLLASGVYNWELGEVHPFAIAGVGLYRVDRGIGGSVARVGAHLGGGVAYFLNRRVAATGQLLLHLLGSARDQRSSFLALGAGVRYFF